MYQTGNPICDGITAAFSLFFVPGFFTLIVVAFFWAICMLIFVGDYDEEARARAKALIIWSILIFIALIIVWALLAWLFGSAFFAGVCQLGRV